jgi:protein gp37
VSDGSNIEWTDATWNPTTGCTKVSPGCAHCYIERTPAFRIKGRKFVNGATDLQLHANRLDQPLRWRKPRRVFVNSLSDLFHDDVPAAFIDQVFAAMALSPDHTFQVLTKRPTRMLAYMSAESRHDAIVAAMDMPAWLPAGRRFLRVPENWPLPNVWLGVSVENQHFADERIPLLLQTPAAMQVHQCGAVAWARCRSAGRCGTTGTPNGRRAHQLPPVQRDGKTLAGSVGHLDGLRLLDWVIVGVEQLAGGTVGRNADAYEAHARSILGECIAAGVAVFHKQMPVRRRVSGDPAEWPEDLRARQFPEVLEGR